MLSNNLDLLTLAVERANTWRTAAQSVGVDLNQINFVFPGGKSVVLLWNETAIANEDGTYVSDWEVST